MVDISPESSIFGIFKSLNYKPWFALAEFVDNAIASWETWSSHTPDFERPKSVKVEIEINTSAGHPYIEIRDNASGIAIQDFDRAFKVASRPANQKSLNEFGMGMKTAGFWFSNDWSVRTSHIGDGVTRTMRFNLDKILAEKTREIQPDVISTALQTHFTTVRLSDLNQVPKGRTVGAIKDHLTDIYRCFIRSGALELVYNGERLTVTEPRVLEAPAAWDETGVAVEWRKPIVFTTNHGRHVTGFAALLEVGSTKRAGFAIFRKNRLIEGSADETFRPSEIFGASNGFTYQRLYGELHLDDFDVTHTKDAVKWGDSESEDFLEKLKLQLGAEPLDLLSQAEKYRKGKKLDTSFVETVVGNVQKTLEKSASSIVQRVQPKTHDLEMPLPEALDHIAHQASKTVVARSIEIDVAEEGLWRVRIELLSDEAMTNFWKIGVKQSGLSDSGRACTDLQLSLNLGHPFARYHLGPNGENLELLLELTASMAIALMLAVPLGAKSGWVIDYVNNVLRFRGQTK